MSKWHRGLPRRGRRALLGSAEAVRGPAEAVKRRHRPKWSSAATAGRSGQAQSPAEVVKVLDARQLVPHLPSRWPRARNQTRPGRDPALGAGRKTEAGGRGGWNTTRSGDSEEPAPRRFEAGAARWRAAAEGRGGGYAPLAGRRRARSESGSGCRHWRTLADLPGARRRQSLARLWHGRGGVVAPGRLWGRARARASQLGRG